MSKKSEMPGSDTLVAGTRTEVLNVSPHGLWLLSCGKEYFLDFEAYPWFKDAPISDIFSVELLHGHHLRWENLDVDLDIKSLNTPENYPLIAR